MREGEGVALRRVLLRRKRRSLRAGNPWPMGKERRRRRRRDDGRVLVDVVEGSQGSLFSQIFTI